MSAREARGHHIRRLTGPLVIVLMTAACGHSGSGTATSTTPATTPATTTAPTGGTTSPTGSGSSPAATPPSASVLASTASRPTKVLVVVEENHTETSALAGMPNLAALARRYGYTTNYKAITHPSLPNYLAIAGGSTFGVTDDKSPAYHHVTGPSAFDRAIAAGKTAKTYAEGMPSNCALSSYARYAVRHNPWTYFNDAGPRANCRRFNVPLGTLTSGALRSDIDSGRLPHVSMLIPDACHDAHDCSLATADNWLKPWLSRLMAGPDYRAGRLAIVVTFDEDDKRQDNTVLTVVISPYTNAVVSGTAFTHYSLTRYLAEVVGVTPLRNAATARSMRTTFRL